MSHLIRLRLRLHLRQHPRLHPRLRLHLRHHQRNQKVTTVMIIRQVRLRVVTELNQNLTHFTNKRTYNIIYINYNNNKKTVIIVNF
jgi:hypothetical protein